MKPEKRINKAKIYRELMQSASTDKRKRAYIFIILFAVVLILFVSFIILYNSMKLLRVEFNGLVRTHAPAIIKEANLTKYSGKSLITLPTDDIKKDVEKNPLLKVSSIKRVFPDLIIINIEERETLVLLEYNGKIYEVSDDLFIIRENVIVNYDKPYLTGFIIDDKKLKVEEPYTKYILNLLNEIKISDISLYNTISEINAFGEDLIIYPRVYPVKIFAEKYIKAAKIKNIAAILKTLIDQQEYVKEIDYRFSEAVIRQ